MLYQSVVVSVLTVVWFLPFVAIAQVDTPEDISSVRLLAKAEAERDAQQDVNRLKWGGFGGVLGFVGGGICVTVTVGESAACLIEMGCSAALGEDSDYEVRFESIALGAAGFIIASLPLSYAANLQPTVPSGRLIGKSPEYVTSYTDAYQKSVQRLRMRCVWAGTATGCVLSLFILGPLLETLYPTD